MKRVFVILLLVLAVGGAAIFLLAPRTRAQVQLTLEPSMARGAAVSPVTIIEFSDYQ